MLAVLSDGRAHSRDDIFRACGRFMLTNNAASELRACGYDVRHELQDRVHVYRLAGMLSEPDPVSTPACLSPPPQADGNAEDGASGSDSIHPNQLTMTVAA